MTILVNITRLYAVHAVLNRIAIIIKRSFIVEFVLFVTCNSSLLLRKTIHTTLTYTLKEGGNVI